MKQLHGPLPIIAVIMICMFLLGDSQLNHDTSWYLISTNWWLHGVPLYEEILELNPPLAFYLTMPPVFFADITGLNPVLIMKLYIIIIALISLFWARAILISSNKFTQADITCLCLAASVAMLLVPLRTFGQREHLMILFSWPYIALSLTNPQQHRRRLAGFTGLFAALGFALKPYFLAIPVFITLAKIYQSRSLRPIVSQQNMVILGFCIFYLFAVYALHSEYFTKIIPQTILTYGAYKESMWIVLGNVQNFLILGFVTAIAAIRHQQQDKGVALILASVTLAGLFSYLVQTKGWAYQSMPFQS